MAMRDRYVTFGGVNLNEEYGLIFSSFEEELPEPKVITVSIPSGPDIDITEALGPVGYHNGIHKITFLMYHDTESDMVQSCHALKTLIHGSKANYTLSWEPEYTYTGRATMSVKHLTENADVVCLTIDHTPWRSRFVSVDLVAHPTETYRLEGSTRYANVRVKFLQTGSASVGTHTGSYDDAGTYLLAESVDADADVTVTVLGWLMYLDEEAENMVVRTAYFDMDGNDAQIDGTYTVSAGGNMVFPEEALQHVTLTYTGLDL